MVKYGEQASHNIDNYAETQLKRGSLMVKCGEKTSLATVVCT